MKKLFLFASLVSMSTYSFAQSKADDLVKFNTERHDFGKIKQNEPVSFVFELKNISSKPVVVESTSASCGCTTPERPTEPIMPGATGKIKVQYNAAAMGPFTKEVYIKLAGVNEQKIVYVTGEVLSAEDYEKYKNGQKNGQAAAPSADVQPAKAQTPAAKPVKSNSKSGKPRFTTSKG
ncbi:MAG: DUF1573 domain-containing protein [Chitinophagaceae bacterium]|nr:DUF1573 domain-containing protein [Chitinophagaceae bacterium]